ncbi:MAG: hypothetical protein ACO1OX_00945 [Novosphingobium sp.]
MLAPVKLIKHQEKLVSDHADDFDDHDEEEWDQDFASELIGQTLLVGITYVDPDGELLRRQQIFGTVTDVEEGYGVTILQRHNGEPFVIAPILSAIEYAVPGVYQLSDADMAVEDPDFTALFTVTSPHRH